MMRSLPAISRLNSRGVARVNLVAAELELEAAAREAEVACGACDVAAVTIEGFGD